MLKEFTGSVEQQQQQQRNITVSTMLDNMSNSGRAHLLETYGSSLLAEALTAEVKAVLADETGLVRAETAVRHPVSACVLRLITCSNPPLNNHAARR